jgi:non-specific serine/threonine protein kinase
MLEVRLLGKFEVQHGGKPITISSRPAQSLFSYLILNAGIACRREKLAGMLWPDSLEETARDNLRHALWRVRKVLEAGSATRFLHADDRTISFKSSSEYWLDAKELANVSENASSDQLIAVLSMYQGELLPGFYEEWVLLEREHLSSILEHNMARLMSLLQEEQRWLDVLDWAERWIKLGQKPEPAYRALMYAHAAKGDMSKAAVTYERCVESLKEFGIKPSEQTLQLFERLKSGKMIPETGAAIPVKEKQKDAPKTNLPIPLTSFIGREKEIDRVVQMLGKHRLVTLSGSGGVGKTRLAIQASNKLLHKFRDGIWWMDLAGLNDDALVLQAVAQVAGVREVPNRPLADTLIEDFRSRQILLVVDNCEHLIMGCAQIADRLLGACPNLKMLITSREGLGLMGEEVWHVPTLSLPESLQSLSIELLTRYEGIRLFVERATAVKSDFLLTERNAPAVAEVCQRLDGIPLAIELAAARVRVLSVEQIAARLQDRFDLLTGGSRTAFPRHQTLRAAIDWSYDLLPVQEQTLFHRLAVFAGGWTLEEAQAICAGEELKPEKILDLLTHLVDKSLLIMEEQEGTLRCRMLETIREYARGKFLDSGEALNVRNRHLVAFMQFVEGIEPGLHGPSQAFWLKRLDVEHDNLRAALEWSLTGGQLEAGMRLAGALWLFWDIYGYQTEGRAWLERLLSKYLQGDEEPAPSLSAQAKTLYVAGHLRQRQGDFERAREHYTASLALYHQLQDQIQIAIVLRGLGEIAQDEGDLASARRYFEQSLNLFRSLNAIEGTSIALGHLATLGLLLRDYEQAAAFSTEALAIGQNRGDHRTTAIALTTLGFALCGMGELDEAVTQFTDALALQTTLADKRIAQYNLMGMALVSFTRGQARYAARLFGAADALRETISTPLPPSQQPLYDSLLRSLRAELDEETFQSQWEEGRKLTLQQAIKFALKDLE